MKLQIRMAQYGFIAAGMLALGYCVLVYLDGFLFGPGRVESFSRSLSNIRQLRTPRPTPVRF